MQEDNPGMTVVQAVVSKEGRLLVTIDWPDGFSRILDRDEAVGLALSLLSNAAALFPTATEFSQTIAYARGELKALHPAGVQ
ncbi:MAG: hypothetical protein WBY44_31115 [Bryobacteraceae bacterium]